jgi:hypothetical protein
VWVCASVTSGAACYKVRTLNPRALQGCTLDFVASHRCVGFDPSAGAQS